MIFDSGLLFGPPCTVALPTLYEYQSINQSNDQWFFVYWHVESFATETGNHSSTMSLTIHKNSFAQHEILGL